MVLSEYIWYSHASEGAKFDTTLSSFIFLPTHCLDPKGLYPYRWSFELAMNPELAALLRLIKLMWYFTAKLADLATTHAPIVKSTYFYSPLLQPCPESRDPIEWCQGMERQATTRPEYRLNRVTHFLCVWYSKISWFINTVSHTSLQLLCCKIVHTATKSPWDP